jgi:ribosomal protein S26
MPTKNKIVTNRPSYCVSAASHATWLRRIGQKARKQRSDAGTKRK